MSKSRLNTIARVQSLRNRARDAASSEAEAAAAAQKAAKLIAQHELTEAELVERGASSVVEGHHNTERRRRHPTMRGVWDGIAALTECKHFMGGTAYAHDVWMGQPEDVEFAMYLSEMIQAASERAWSSLRKQGWPHSAKRRNSFLEGFGMAVGLKLHNMATERKARRAAGPTGTSLVVQKNALIGAYTDEKYGKIHEQKAAKRERDTRSMSMGIAAGSNLNVKRPIEETEGNTQIAPE